VNTRWSCGNELRLRISRKETQKTQKIESDTPMRYLLWNTKLAGWHRDVKDGIEHITSHLDLAGKFDASLVRDFVERTPNLMVFPEVCVPWVPWPEEKAVEGKEHCLFVRDDDSGCYALNGVLSALQGIQASIEALEDGDRLEIALYRQDMTPAEIAALPCD
jgi:hypothetical protein